MRNRNREGKPGHVKSQVGMENTYRKDRNGTGIRPNGGGRDEVRTVMKRKGLKERETETGNRAGVGTTRVGAKTQRKNINDTKGQKARQG